MKRVIKGNIIAYFVLLSIVITTMIIIKTQIIERKLPERDYNVISNDTLRIVTNIYYDENIDGITFINYELADLIGEESGLIYKIDTINSISESITHLNNNTFDIIARPIVATSDSKNNLLFTNIFKQRKNSLVVIQREDGNIKTNLDLVQKNISIIDDAGIQLIIENIAYEIGDSIYIDVKRNCSIEQLIAMVADSTIEYTVCTDVMAKRMREFFPQLDVNTKISVPVTQAWAVRHSSPTLRDSLNVWLERVKNSNKYKDLMNKYGF